MAQAHPEGMNLASEMVDYFSSKIVELSTVWAQTVTDNQTTNRESMKRSIEILDGLAEFLEKVRTVILHVWSHSLCAGL